MHTLEYDSATRGEEILPSAITWMDLEITMLGEISQTGKGENHMMSLKRGIRT